MEDHKAWYHKLNFTEYRVMVRHTLRFPGEVTSSDQRPPPRKLSSSEWMKRIVVTLGKLAEKPTDVYFYEVPNELRKVNEGAYSPHIVSIGPLHHGEPALSPMEEHKWQYMLYLLQRTPEEVERNVLVECGKAILELEKSVRGSYAKSLMFNPYELVEILLVDGCFMLELFLRSLDLKFKKDSDLIFRNAWMVPTLQHDLALLENQIPFIVLEKLFRIFMFHIPGSGRFGTIDHIALSFFQPKKKQETTINIEDSHDVKHLLDLLHNFYLLTCPQMDPKGEKTRGFPKCATQLLEAGVELKKGTVDNLLNIRFSNGVLTIPPLHIDEMKDSLLRNLIAFEQCSLGSTRHITSYVFLIKSLIHSSADIELLEQKEILTNSLGGGVQDVLAFFNNISKEIILEDFYFDMPCSKVNAYQKSLWRPYCHKAFWKVGCYRQISALKRNYFPNAWRGMSVFAAILLLFLTSAQTYYSARPYLHFH